MAEKDKNGDIITDRGFRHAEPTAGTYNDSVRVYESSAAMGPHVWILATNADGVDVAVHLAREAALAFADDIKRVCELHYQGPDA